MSIQLQFMCIYCTFNIFDSVEEFNDNIQISIPQNANYNGLYLQSTRLIICYKIMHINCHMNERLPLGKTLQIYLICKDYCGNGNQPKINGIVVGGVEINNSYQLLFF